MKPGNLSLTTKFLAIGIIIVAILGFGLMSFFTWMFKRNTIDSFVSKARSIALATESVRLEMDEKWQQGIFTIEQARGYYEKQQLERLLNMVPVVTAWRAAQNQAKAGNYTFRVPKFSPRNPDNEPDHGLNYDIEGPALTKLKQENLSEYYVIDKQANAVRYFLPIRLSETCLICHGDPKTSEQLWGISNGRDPSGGTMENWKVGELHGAFEIIQSLDPADALIARTIRRALLITLAGMTLSAIGYYLLIKYTVIKPIYNVSSRLEHISSGDADLTQRLFVLHDDEIGKLVENFNQFVEKLQVMMKQVTVDTITVRNASQQLSGISRDISGTSQGTSSRTSNAFSSTNILSNNMAAIATAMEEATSNINIMAAAAEELNATLNDISNNSENALNISSEGVEQSIRASEQISALDKAAQDIGKITEAIAEISDQTNLLALNATIEAARAGEAGKGFTIVANEIKDLSYQTAEATSKIKNQIENVQRVITTTLAEIGGMTRIINDINGITTTVAGAVEEQTNATNEISSNIGQASAAIAEISGKVSESALMAEQINDELSAVNVAAENIADGSLSISESVDKLEQLSTNLHAMVERFKT